MMRDLRLFLALLLLPAFPAVAAAQAPEAPVQFAQYYDPGTDIAEVYVDEFGRRVLIDAFGRIVAVEEPRRDRFQERRQQFEERGAIIDAPPPPGVTLQGRVDLPPPDVFEEPGFSGQPRSADPYYDGPYEDDRGYNAAIESSPLPDAGAPVQEAELPADAWGSPGYQSDLPAPDAPIVEGETIFETDPAPQVATPTGRNAKAEIAALQVLLDRAGMSPGVIDGRMGSNVNKAVAAYEEKYGRSLPTGDARALAEELDATGGPAIVTYEITAEDVAGPYVAAIPSDYSEKALLPAMSYERVSEKLAEKFHMDEAYLIEINPGADFSRQGTRLKVMSVGDNATGEVARIVADKGREQVRAYAADGSLLAAYPSTIGSSSTPSPSGVVQVSRIALDPNYTYNPKINFKQGDNDKVLTIPPGPNGPVGTVWIALSKPTYGIHGTPEPSQIGKTNSYGCVRLTNWDAAELAKMVKPGVTVEFEE